MSYVEFVDLVKKSFMEMGYSEKTTNAYFATKDTQTILRKHYDGYNESNVSAYSPIATASCLDMLY